MASLRGISPRALSISPSLAFRMSAPHSPQSAALSEQLRSGSQPKQLVALIKLERLPSDTALDILQSSNLLTSSNQQVRQSAVATLGKLGVLSQTSTLVSILADKEEDYSVRAAAANSLGRLLEDASGDGVQPYISSAVGELLRVVEEDEEFIVRYASIVALGNVGDAVVLPHLLKIVKDSTAPGLEAAAAVGAIGEVVKADWVDEGLLVSVCARASDREDLVRAAVARTLGRWRAVANVENRLLSMRSSEEKYGESPMVLAILDDALGPEQKTEMQ